ncbi:MAG TPA: SpoIID/LytB domain-containing protein, partial [Ignavibacteriaceae bacterium]|nr:SpoIID/LytB domain-containing protein [Ignavibacteriaceae bacterium]
MTNQQPMISVGILTEKQVQFELYGDFKCYGMKNTFSGRYSAEIVGDKIICRRENEKLEIIGEIIFEPQEMGMESFLIRNVSVGDKFHWQKKENERFIGQLKLLKNEDKITVINILPIENYLTSVISSEMSAKSPVDALKAHAIISRSWLLSQLSKKGKEKTGIGYDSDTEHIKWYDMEEHDLFDVCNDDHCQRYHGITKVFTGVASKATEQTAGLVLMNGDEICDARYSKCCGGISENFENVWAPVNYPYLKSVIDYKYEPENFNLNLAKEENAEKWVRGKPHSFCNTTDRTVLSKILVDFDQSTKD